jgi:hypothetical protein
MKPMLLYAALLAVVGICLFGFQHADGERVLVVGGMSGSIHTQLKSDNADYLDILLPGITVFVRRIDTGAVIQETRTQGDGYYEFKGLAAGRYQVCWSAPGWLSDCQLDPVLLSPHGRYVNIDLDAIGIVPVGGRAIAGRVRLADGNGCRYSNTQFGIDRRASVSALDGTGHLLMGPVPANNVDEYVLAGVPPEDIHVQATCGDGVTEGEISASRTVAGVVPLDLTFSGLSRGVAAITARLGGQPVRSVPPGSVVDLAVESEVGAAGPLQYRWASTPGFGGIVSSDGNRARWIAPSEPTDGQIHVLASNGRGSLAAGAIVVRVGSLELGAADPPDPAYAEQVVTDGMPPAQKKEYIPPYKGYVAGQAVSAFLTREDNGGNTTATYYKVVVGNNYVAPNNCGNNARCTLGGWLMANGWNADGTPTKAGQPPCAGCEARTVFLNNNDLGYVRDMHCRSKDIDPQVQGTNVACWVTNYSSPNQEVPGPPFAFPPVPDETRLAADFKSAEAMDATKAQATVTMEYRVIAGVNNGNPVVTFIAYGNPAGNPPVLGSAPIAETSDQDGFSGKPVPGMCNNCHGGPSYDGTGNANGVFIVFDLSTFLYSTDAGWKRADLEPIFKLQNMAVLVTNPPAAVTEVIQGWYGGGGLGRATALDTFAPPAWTDKDANLATKIGANQKLGRFLTTQNLYLNVVRTCRTCHTARPAADNISWNTYAQFNRAFNQVCGTMAQRDMPHAAISYLNFWRFKPPDTNAYPLGGPGATAPMQQPFLDMGTFMAANNRGVGICKNTKGLGQ